MANRLQRPSPLSPLVQLASAIAFVVVSVQQLVTAQEAVTLKNGMRLEGSFGRIPSMTTGINATKPAGEVPTASIVVIDDRMRRYFVNVSKLTGAPVPVGAASHEVIKIHQRVISAGSTLGIVGDILAAEPFDQWGRRTCRLRGPRGRTYNLVQAMTEITPVHIRLETVQGGDSIIWSTQIATSSVPRQLLSAVLHNHIDRKNPDQRLRIVRLYIQADRIQDASVELQAMQKDFPDLERLNDQIDKLRQLAAQRLLKEIEQRRAAGQHQMAIYFLKNFPQQGVAGELLLKVSEMVEEYEQQKVQAEKLVGNLEKQLEAIPAAKRKEQLTSVVTEIKTDLNFSNLDRLGDYQRLSDDAALSDEQKVSLAVSGWILGGGSSIDNVAVATSLVQVRDIVREYLASHQKGKRDELLASLQDLEGGTPVNVAKILANLKPPVATDGVEVTPGILAPPAAPPMEEMPEEESGIDAKSVKFDRKINQAGAEEVAEKEQAIGEVEETPDLVKEKGKIPGTGVPKEKKEPGQKKPIGPKKPLEDESEPAAGKELPAGFHILTAKGVDGQQDFKYLVQLPPEYDPYKRYPLVISLATTGSSPVSQIDWWAGVYNAKKQMRMGQAGRHGYIIVAPFWTKELQINYEYSLREHACVLHTLQDCLARFAVDSDRVFLAGHGKGGDAAWDIGLAHPDLWAGVIPLSAVADKYVSRYWENAEYLPFYFVYGERDGGKLEQNAKDWDRYLTRNGNYDCTIVQFQERGGENLGDELLRIYDWMNLHRRNFYPAEVETVSMRPWDSFFWSVEVAGLPSSSVVMPVDWETKKGALPSRLKIRVLPLATNGVTVKTSTTQTTVWLSPEMVDFSRKVSVSINGKKVSTPAPSAAVILEDARTRGDRQHPFWAKVGG